MIKNTIKSEEKNGRNYSQFIQAVFARIAARFPVTA